MVAGKSRRLTNSATAPGDRPRSAGRTINSGTPDLRAIQALAVIEQPVLPQPFAVIGGHDHERLIEHAATLEVVDQFTQPLVQISQAVVVGIANERPRRRGNPPLVGLRPALGQEPKLGIGSSAPNRSGYEPPGGSK